MGATTEVCLWDVTPARDSAPIVLLNCMMMVLLICLVAPGGTIFSLLFVGLAYHLMVSGFV